MSLRAAVILTSRRLLACRPRAGSTFARPQPFKRRIVTAHPPPTSEISIERYHALSDSTMDRILVALEHLVDLEPESNFEVEYHSGVLTLKLADNGTYVINKQPPNQQIWLSSPFSGPKRFDFSGSTWVYRRTGETLLGLMQKELAPIFGSEHVKMLSAVDDE